MDIRNDNALVLPVNTKIKLIVSNAAVTDCWTISTFGVNKTVRVEFQVVYQKYLIESPYIMVDKIYSYILYIILVVYFSFFIGVVLISLKYFHCFLKIMFLRQ